MGKLFSPGRDEPRPPPSSVKRSFLDHRGDPRTGGRRRRLPFPGMDLANKRSGHTLLELAVALAIVGILAGIGWTFIQPQVDRFRMMRAARLLQSDLQMMRAMAIATSRETRVKFIASDAALDPEDVQVGEWNLQVGDHSQNSVVWDTLPVDEGTPDASEGERNLGPDGSDAAPHVSLAPWSTLAGPAGDNADCLVFSPRGWVSNPATDFASGYVDLRIVNKRTSAEAVIRVSRGGLTRLEVSEATALPSTTVGTGEATTR